MTMRVDTTGPGNSAPMLTRKRFLAFLGSMFTGVPLVINSCTKNEKRAVSDDMSGDDPAAWWKTGGYMVHESVDSASLDRGRIKAKVDGEWREFAVQNLPREFIGWSLSERANRLKRLAMYGFQRRDLAGPHNACVATFGGLKRDSSVSINTAYKGMGFVPRKEKLSATISRLKRLKTEIERADAHDFHTMLAHKTEELGKIYAEKDLFDPTKQVSLELFTTYSHPTHTFLNMMANPVTSASFLDFPAFELRAIPQLLHPANPGLSSYEREITDFTNVIHNFIHGGSSVYIACVYHVIEVFDDSPNAGAMGKRIA
jgi:hypothetical protein